MMSWFLTISCILSAFIAKGYSLTCTQCISMDGSQCTGPSVSCASSDYACTSSYTVTIMGSIETSKQFVRVCEKKTNCGKAGSVTIPGGRIRSVSTCCYTDNCTPIEPVFPHEKTGKNGIKCDGCIAINSRTCETDTKVECSGNEDMCITQISTVSGRLTTVTAVRGCASKEVCEVGNQNIELENVKMNIDTTCTGGSICLQHSFILLAFAAFLHLKLIC
ncbi:phospholipase A2 inhibitor NAI-like [Rhinophrynus dorsalis]